MVRASFTCNLPNDFDRAFSKKHIGFPPQRVADLRASYEMEHKKDPFTEFNDETNRLMEEEILNRRKQNIQTVISKGNSKVRTLLGIKLNTTAGQREEVINTIAYWFTEETTRDLERLRGQLGNPNLTREDLLAGNIVDTMGKRHSEFTILDTVLNKFYGYYNKHRNESTKEAEKALDLCEQVFKYWGGFISLARRDIMLREGILSEGELAASDFASYENFLEGREDFNPEENTLESWQLSSEERDPYASIGTRVRRVLSSLPAYHSEFQKETKSTITVQDKTAFGTPIFMKASKAHRELLVIARGASNKEDLMRGLFKEYESGRSWIYPILMSCGVDINELGEANYDNLTYFATQLYVDLKRNFQWYSGIAKDKKGNLKDTVLNSERTQIYLNKILSNIAFHPEKIAVKVFPWSEATSPSVVINKDGNVNPEGVAMWKDRELKLPNGTYSADAGVYQLLSMETEEKDEKGNTVKKRVVNLKEFNKLDERGKYNNRVNTLWRMLADLGIQADLDTLIYIVRKGNTRHLAQHLVDLAQYGFTASYTKGKASSISYYSLFGKDDEGNDSVFSEYYKKIIKVLNDNTTSINKLYKVRTKNARGKSSERFSDVNPSYLGTFLEKIAALQETNNKEGLKQLLMDEFFMDPSFAELEDGKPVKIYNPMLRDLWKQATSNAVMEVTVSNVNESLYTDKTVSENMSEKTHAVTEITKYFSKYAGNGKAWYPVFILGDSNKLKYVVGKKYSKNEDMYKEFYSLYLREIKQAQVFEDFNKQLTAQGYKELSWIDRNDKLSLLQTMQPYFDKHNIKYTDTNQLMSEEEFIAAFKEVIGDTATMTEGAAWESLKYYKKLGVFDKGSGNVKFAALKGVNAFRGEVGSDEFKKDWLNYYLNRKLNMACQLNILDIDTRVIPNSKELQKRNKQNIAPGTTLDVEASWNDEPVFKEGEARVQKTCYFKDINANLLETDPGFMEVIKNTFGENSEVYKDYLDGATLTDGQGYRTLDSYRKVMIMAGKWNDASEAIYQKILNIRNGKVQLSEEALKELQAEAVIFQPIKPFLYTHEQIVYGKNGEVVTIPTQLKYAEAVIIPELMKDCSLKTMAEWMQEKGVDVICSTKCVKSGEFGAVDISKAKSKDQLLKVLNDGFTDDNGEATKLGVHALNYTDYRIQTNVPPHIDQSRSIGTQIRKLIMSDLVFGENGRYNHYFDGIGKIRLSQSEPQQDIDNVDAKRLVNIYNSLIVSNILTAFDRFEKTVSNNKKLSKLLQGTVLQNDRVSVDALMAFGLTGNAEFLVPLFEASFEHDVVAEILSIFRKDVNKLKMAGGSAVQVSAYGISEYEESKNLKVITNKDKTNILAVECEIPFILNYTDEFGKAHNLEYNDYCNLDGTLKMEDGKPKIEKYFPGILDIIAYRVPTERNYSTLNLRVVRFTKPSEGGTIKVPAQFTKVAGFDFDIDKLYFLRKEFKVAGRNKHENQQAIKEAWEAIYAGEYNGGTYDNRNFDLLYNAQTNAFKRSGLRDEKNFRKEHPLYEFWEEAGLEGTAQEVFDAYLEDHPDVKKKVETISQGVEDIIWDKYNPNTVPEAQSTTARNNLLLHIMRQRLMDKETLESRYKPGGFDNSKAAARILRELTLNPNVKSLHEAIVNQEADPEGKKDPEPSYDPTDPQTMLLYNQMNQAAGKLIGIFANQNINHALASLAEELSLRTPIAFDGHTEGLSDLLHNNDIDTFQTVAEFLAASVDAVKDPVLNYLNFNIYTANAAGLLARLGYKPYEIGLLFNQPIIKEVCEKAQNDDFSSLQTAIASIKKKYADKGDTRGKFSQGELKIQASNEALADYIIKANKFNNQNLMEDRNLADIQFKILNMFEDILNAADELNDFISATRFTSANSVGSTMGDVYEQNKKVEQYLEKINRVDPKTKKPTNYLNIRLSATRSIPVTTRNAITHRDGGVDVTSYLAENRDNPFAYEQCMYDCMSKLPKILEKVIPYETPLYSRLRDFASKFVTIKLGRLKAETINNLHRDFVTYYLSSLKGSMWDSRASMNEANQLYKHTKPVSRGYYYRYNFAQDYVKFADEHHFIDKYPNLSSVLLSGVSRVETDIEGSKFLPEKQLLMTLNMVSSRGQDSIRQDVKDAITDELEQMAIDYPNAAFGLYFYNFFQMGHSFGGNSLVSYFPTTMIASLPVGIQTSTGKKETYTDILNTLLKGGVGAFDGSYNYNEFIKQFILNHLDDMSFTYTPNKEAREEFAKIKKAQFEEDGKTRKSFILSAKEDIKENSVFNPIIGYESDNVTPIWAPIIAVRESSGEITYYMADNAADRPETGFNVGQKCVYREVEPLGQVGSSVRYGSSINAAKSELRVVPSQEAILTNDITESVSADNEDSDFASFDPSDITSRLGKIEEEEFVDARLELIAQKIAEGKNPLIDDSGEEVCF